MTAHSKNFTRHACSLLTVEASSAASRAWKNVEQVPQSIVWTSVLGPAEAVNRSMVLRWALRFFFWFGCGFSTAINFIQSSAAAFRLLDLIPWGVPFGSMSLTSGKAAGAAAAATAPAGGGSPSRCCEAANCRRRSASGSSVSLPSRRRP